jgi:hypothetical protein
MEDTLRPLDAPDATKLCDGIFDWRGARLPRNCNRWAALALDIARNRPPYTLVYLAAPPPCRYSVNNR